jgi:hypothetical protein
VRVRMRVRVRVRRLGQIRRQGSRGMSLSRCWRGSFVFECRTGGGARGVVGGCGGGARALRSHLGISAATAGIATGREGPAGGWRSWRRCQGNAPAGHGHVCAQWRGVRQVEIGMGVVPQAVSGRGRRGRRGRRGETGTNNPRVVMGSQKQEQGALTN